MLEMSNLLGNSLKLHLEAKRACGVQSIFIVFIVFLFFLLFNDFLFVSLESFSITRISPFPRTGVCFFLGLLIGSFHFEFQSSNSISLDLVFLRFLLKTNRVNHANRLSFRPCMEPQCTLLKLVLERYVAP